MATRRDPSPWTRPRRIEREYQRAIERLITSVTRGEDFIRSIAILPPQDNFLILSARRIASAMVTQLQAANARNWREAASKGSRGREIYESIRRDRTGIFRHSLAEITRENAAMITSIPDRIRAMIEKEMYEMQAEGLRASEVSERLLARVPQITRSRAELIARTETSKAATALTRVRAQAIGIEWYEWRTSEDQRVRPSHRRMDRVLVRWTDPPNPERLAHEANVRHGPYNAGNIWNCRCDSYPLVHEDQVEWPHKVYADGKISSWGLAKFRRISRDSIAA